MKKAALLLAPCVMLSGCLSADPHNFTCKTYLAGEDEKQVLFDYSPTPRIEGIRRFAGDDFKVNEINTLGAPTRDNSDVFEELSKRIFSSEGVIRNQADEKKHDAILILSGGGQWGAFGAGFLKAWQDGVESGQAPKFKDYKGVKITDPTSIPEGPPAIRAVTGISTGALQAIFASIGDFDEIVEAYSVDAQEDVVIDRGIFRGAIRQGASLDTSPLVERLRSRLCEAGEDGFSCGRLASIHDKDTRLLIGLVNAETGDLQVVDVKQMVDNAYSEMKNKASKMKAKDRARKENELADCVTGVAMASAAVPAQLRPVRIDGRAYVDGGVRAAVFSDFVGKTLETYAGPKDAPKNKAPVVYVVRNGPTVIPPPEKGKDDPEIVDVSEKPTILRIALRSYSAIVNQNEMSSVAELLRLYKRPIYFVSADGFNTAEYNTQVRTADDDTDEGCRYPPEADAKDKAFNPTFMKCLIDWGGLKYSKYGWTQIKDESGAINQAGGK